MALRCSWIKTSGFYLWEHTIPYLSEVVDANSFLHWPPSGVKIQRKKLTRSEYGTAYHKASKDFCALGGFEC